jgi:Cof subfamily protein (haloacid dehalogenase superfamily)
MAKNETRIKLIALDLDGTVMDRERIISPRVRSAFNRAISQGCLVTIATGRGFAPVARFAVELGVNVPLICYQGALIRDHRDGTVIYSATVPLDVARDVIAFSQDRELNFQVYMEDDRAYVNQIDTVAGRIADLSGIPVTAVNDLAAWLSRPPLKFMFFEQEDSVLELVRDLQIRFDGHLQVVRSWDRLVEATGPDISKGEALSRLAAHLGVSQSATMAVGDQDNDVSMIAWAGLGVAMGNASPAARSAADVIAPPLIDDGAAWAIERFILGEQAGSSERLEDSGPAR